MSECVDGRPHDFSLRWRTMIFDPRRERHGYISVAVGEMCRFCGLKREYAKTGAL